MIKMSNLNIKKRGTQANSLGVMIGRRSLDSQHPIVILRMLAVFFSGTCMTTLATTTIRTKRKIWTKEDNQLALHCYFKNNPSQRGYRKRMIDLAKCASFQTCQRLADRVRTVIKKGWFFDLEIIEIHQKTQKEDNTIPVISSGANQKQHTRNELPTFENKNATLPCNPVV